MFLLGERAKRVKGLNDSQDPEHTLFCHKNLFVAIYGVAERGLFFIAWLRYRAVSGPFFRGNTYCNLMLDLNVYKQVVIKDGVTAYVGHNGFEHSYYQPHTQQFR